MARDHARIRLDIWADDEFRDLTSNAQWLYLHLLSSPLLNFAGVMPWRPGVIAGHTAELAVADVEAFAMDLESGLFVVIDRRTDEALIRSWVKHDGLMQSPNMAKALVKAHAQVGSTALRAVVVHELKRLKRKEPGLKGWPNASDLLRKRSMSPTDAIAALPPNPSGNPSAKGSGKASPTPVLLPSLTPSLPNSPSSSSPSVTRGAANG